MELGGVFCYGPDIKDRIEGFKSNPFWKNVLAALRTLWSSNCIFNKDTIIETPLWYNPPFSLQKSRELRENDKMVISDLIDYLKVPLSMENINVTYNIKMNFLEYGNITSLINNHLDWKDIPIIMSQDPNTHS